MKRSFLFVLLFLFLIPPSQAWKEYYGKKGCAGGAAAECPDKGFIISYSTDTIDSNNSYKRLITIQKIDQCGKVLWAKNLYSDSSGFVKSIKRNSQGNYLLLGTIEILKNQYYVGSKMFMIEMDGNGMILKNKFFNHLYDYAYAANFEFGDSSSIYIAGETSYLYQRTFVMKVNNNLDVIWTKIINNCPADANEYFEDITRARDGGFLLTGTGTISYVQGIYYHFLRALKIRKDGTTVWDSLIYGPQSNGTGLKIFELSNSDILVHAITQDTVVEESFFILDKNGKTKSKKFLPLKSGNPIDCIILHDTLFTVGIYNKKIFDPTTCYIRQYDLKFNILKTKMFVDSEYWCPYKIIPASNGFLITGTNPNYSYPGKYPLQVNYLNFDDSSYTCTPLTINKVLATGSFNIYPNPARDMLHFYNADKTKSIICIYNMLGVKTKEIAVDEEGSEADISDLSPGLYQALWTGNGKVLYKGKLAVAR